MAAQQPSSHQVKSNGKQMNAYTVFPSSTTFQ
jgi:hypothetical protein